MQNREKQPENLKRKKKKGRKEKKKERMMETSRLTSLPQPLLFSLFLFLAILWIYGNPAF